MEEVIEKLRNIGLTESEAKIYIVLLQHRELKAGMISKKVNIPSSHIYEILDKLLKKGLISFKLINNVKIFLPADPESIYSIIREKEEQIEREKRDLKEFISNLKKIEIKEHKQNDFKYFEGINGVRSMFTEFITNSEPNTKMYIASAPIAYEKWNAFLIELFHKPRIKNNIHLQIIIPTKLKKYGKERKKLRPIEIKYSETEMESEFGVTEDYVYFLSYGDKPYALLIKDKNFANTHKKIFKTMWDTIKN